MTAKEAREQATSINNTTLLSQYNDIMREIEKAVKSGELKTYYYKSLHANVATQLRGEGYKVTQDSDRDGILVTIEW